MDTHSWDKHVDLSIFGVYIVDTYNVATTYIISNVFFCILSEEIINTNLGSRPTRPTSKKTGRSALPVPVRKRVTAYLFQTRKKEYHKRGDALTNISKVVAESAK